MIGSVVASLNARLPAAPAPAWPMALGRIAMGVLWLASLRWKLPPNFESAGNTSLREWLELEVKHPAIGFYGNLVESVVLPNFILFAWLVFLAELGVGLGLVFGIGTNLAALTGLLMSINLFVGLAAVPGEWPWSYLMMIMWHGAILATAAGSIWSLDSLRSTKATPQNLHPKGK